MESFYFCLPLTADVCHLASLLLGKRRKKKKKEKTVYARKMFQNVLLPLDMVHTVEIKYSRVKLE